MKSRRATLALGGGGARGVAHLGAIEELVTANFEVERIIGVSIGSLAGALYAFDPDINYVLDRTCTFLQSPEFARHQERLLRAQPGPVSGVAAGVLDGYHRVADFVRANRMLYRAVSSSSLLPGELLEQVVDHLLPDADIADAAIPLSIVAVDLHTGQPFVFDKGPVRMAARASAAIPGIFPPVPFEDRLLCDIGGFCALPLTTARSYAPKFLIAVDVGSTLQPLSEEPSALDVLLRMNDIGSAMFREQLRAEADLTIVPDVAHIPWFDFTSADAMIDAGRHAAREAVSKLPPQRSTLQRLLTDSLQSLLQRKGESVPVARGAMAYHP